MSKKEKTVTKRIMDVASGVHKSILKKKLPELDFLLRSLSRLKAMRPTVIRFGKVFELKAEFYIPV